ncbi:MAG: PilZ domain-containing protein [Candidatus Omnitrophica bacterium]|nr:PilZ domain-containing protein [Candidatus Omnitrophota bacterium]
MFSQNSEKVPSQTDNSGPNNDNRYLPRWEVNNRIVCKVKETADIYECRSMDISCSGACLISRESIPFNEKVHLTVYLTEDEHLDVDGHVVWTRPAQYGNLMGIMFDNLKTEIQELILDYAFEIKKDDVQKHWFDGWNKEKE